MPALQHSRRARRRAVSALAVIVVLACSAPALAGGLGAFNATGLHVGQALSEQQDQGRWIDEGGGVEIVLGADDARLKGRLRLAYNAIISLDGGVRHSGVMGIGATVGLLSDMTRPFGLYLATDVGVSPLVQDMQFYFFADLGPGVRVRVADRFTLFAELGVLFRYDTAFSGGLLMSLGVRVPFE